MLPIRSFSFRRSALLLGTAGLLLLTGCVGDMPRSAGWVPAPQNKRLQQAYGQPRVPRTLTVPAPLRVAPAKSKAAPGLVRSEPKRPQ